MRKPIFIAIFLATLAFPVVPQVTHAQTATTQDVADLEATIRALLLQLIAQLQSQLNDLIASQAQTKQAVTAVQTQVNAVVQNTTPIVGAVVPTPAPSPTPVQLASQLSDHDLLQKWISDASFRSSPGALNLMNTRIPWDACYLAWDDYYTSKIGGPYALESWGRYQTACADYQL